MRIEILEEKDIAALTALERSCFSKPWSESVFRELINNERAILWGVFEEETLLGYSALEWVLDEGSLTNIAVDPDFRRKGYACALMEKLVDFSKEEAMSVILLEVRASNESAIKLYEKFGFETMGVRKNYYSAPTEDALLMTLKLK